MKNMLNSNLDSGRRGRPLLYLLLAGMLALSTPLRPPSVVSAAPPDVPVLVDATVRHQTIEGFGASSTSWGECGEQLGSMRPAVIEAVYNEVKLTMGGIAAGPYEGVWSPAQGCGWDQLQKSNDDSDSNNFNWQNFQWWRSDPAKTLLVDLAQPYGFNNFHLLGTVSSRWADQWLNDIRSRDYNLYLREAAENSVAVLVHWRDSYGIVPIWHQPFNEPLSGNNEVYGGSTQEIVDLVKAIGARLRQEGFADIKMVVPNEETEEKSLATATAILSDPIARQYVGAIGFHPYPYGSAYADVGRILATSGRGQPLSDRIQIRAQMRSLAQQYGLQTWMSEVSNGGGNTFDTLRARAIHIHDEMIYTDVSSYWGMDNIYLDGPGQDETIALFNTDQNTFRISGMGYAIGHYARWVNKGAVRIDANSGDPLVQVTAFRDDTASSLALVLINNAPDSRNVHVSLNGLSLSGNLRGESSTASGYWQPLPPVTLSSATDFTMALPPYSVTSAGGSFANATSSGNLAAGNRHPGRGSAARDAGNPRR
jgi:O-glycosyl hydrolase